MFCLDYNDKGGKYVFYGTILLFTLGIIAILILWIADIVMILNGSLSDINGFGLYQGI